MSKHRLLLLFTESRKEILLTDYLPTFDIVSLPQQAVTSAGIEVQDLDLDVDLIVLDLDMLTAYREQLAAWRRRVAPLFLPTLVLAPTASLKTLTVELREQLDALINDPINPIELEIAIALLLKTRGLSRELLRQNQRTETATKSRSRFISTVAHELRNPLSVISALTQLLQRNKGNLPPEKQKDLIEKIQVAVKRLTKLIDGLLSFNRVSSRQVAFRPKAIDLEKHCQAVLSDVELINQGMYKIHFQTKGDCTNTCVDVELVTTILNNLLTNALKYSPDDSPVSLILERQKEQIVLKVVDTGQGIPEADQSALFDAFFRARNVGKIQGNGLGLSITKECVDLHGGTIDMESEVGRGTTFTVSLPC